MQKPKAKLNPLVLFLNQIFRLKVLWVAMALHITALVFIFHNSLVTLIYLVLTCFSLYCFLAAALMIVGRKEISLGGAYFLAAVLIITTTFAPIGSELEGFRYWLKFVPDQQKYESEVAKLVIGKDGFRRGRWDWGPDPDGGAIELVYDASDQVIPIHSGEGVDEFHPVHITGHFYFVRTIYPSVI